MQKDSKNPSESHPLFPSGVWEGFYTYAMGPDADQHKMNFSLDFHNKIVTGYGSDDVGGFSWKGAYDTENLSCKMTKHYATHTVLYNGNVDENGIWGTWSINWFSGGFHIWPKSNKNKEEAAATIVKNISLKMVK